MKEELAVNKIIRFIQTYLVVGLPLVIACMVWETFHPQNEILKDATIITRMLWEVLAWNLMLWFVVLILFLIMLVAVPNAREKTLRRLANLKERDEREEYITGKASRAAYISTLSLMIFFLFFSIFSFNIYRTPNKSTNRKPLTVGISIGFNLLDKYSAEDNPKREMLFKSKDFSLSPSAIILILLSWQLLIFNLTARKEQIKGAGQIDIEA